MRFRVIEPTEKSHMTEDEIRFQVNNIQVPQWIVDEYVSYPLYELKWYIYRIVKVANTHSFMFVYTRRKIEDIDPWEIVCEMYPGQGWLRKMGIWVEFASECGKGGRNRFLLSPSPRLIKNVLGTHDETCACVTGRYLTVDSYDFTVSVEGYKQVWDLQDHLNVRVKEMVNSVIWRE